MAPAAMPTIAAQEIGRARRAVRQVASRQNSTVESLTKVLDQRVAALRRRIDTAVDRGELPPVDSSFLGEMISGPVHLIVDRGMRPFTRTDAERIVAVVLAGIRANTLRG